MVEISASIHPDFRSQVEAAADALASAYPWVKFTGVELFEPKGNDRSLGFAGDGVISINSYWFSQPKSLFEGEVLKARTATPTDFPAWHGRIGDVEHEVDRLIAHEFGHLLSEGLKGYKEFASAGHAAAVDSPQLAVSGYALAGALDDPDEWWAETFAALRLGGAGSPQVAELHAFLEAEWQQEVAEGAQEVREPVERDDSAAKLDEALRRTDALKRRQDEMTLDRCIELVEAFIPIQQFSGQYAEICSKLGADE